MDSVLASGAVDSEFEPRSGQTKDCKLGFEAGLIVSDVSFISSSMV
jgi:hypothetical protein